MLRANMLGVAAQYNWQASSMSTSAAFRTANLKGKAAQAAASGGPSTPMQPSDGGTSRPDAVPYS